MLERYLKVAHVYAYNKTRALSHCIWISRRSCARAIYWLSEYAAVGKDGSKEGASTVMMSTSTPLSVMETTALRDLRSSLTSEIPSPSAKTKRVSASPEDWANWVRLRRTTSGYQARFDDDFNSF